MEIQELKEKAEILSKEINEAMDKFYKETGIIPEIMIIESMQQTRCGELKYINIRVKARLC